MILDKKIMFNARIKALTNRIKALPQNGSSFLLYKTGLPTGDHYEQVPA